MATNVSLWRIWFAACCSAVALAPTTAWAAAVEKAPSLVMDVFLGDKPVGSTELRIMSGKEASHYSIQAHLQDKVAKVWRSFTERAYLPFGPKGEITQYDRWIDVTGATSQAKLFNNAGQWRVAFTDSAVDGKKPKPKVADVQLKAPFVVLDERLPMLVALAAERMAGQQSFDYVRVDDATSGHLTLSSETLTDKAGQKYHRISMKGAHVDLEVLRDHGGRVLSIKGLDKWRAVTKDVKIPKDLQVAEAPPKVDEPAREPVRDAPPPDQVAPPAGESATAN